MEDTRAFLVAAVEGVYLDVHLQPGARREALVGMHGGRLKIAVTAPPRDGRANDAARRIIAGIFGRNLSEVVLTAGGTSRRKRFYLRGLDEVEARRCLQQSLAG